MGTRFKYLETKPFLEGLEECGHIWNFSDISLARMFYDDLKDISTSTFVLFGKEKGKFKVTDQFPLRNIKKRYLGNSDLGEESIIEILPDEYTSVDAEEFQIVSAYDTIMAKFVMPVSQYKERLYLKQELIDLRASPIGVGLTIEERRRHHVWQALFNNKKRDLEDFIEFVNLQESQARSMPIFLEYAGKYTAVAWQSCSFRRHFCAIGNEGFDIEKRFLLDIIEEKALAQGKS
ncbi:MAG: hypothetical protein QT08_C0004G0003 [archaeon GW2011_AR17]|nr:MAG: hypothetical protein QT08_C0004G0003 [archaeon GW2011_AR17]MBS3154757.1 hypothetical protein [Candidatus Woesearchaeota archaeon]HIH15440.1 hypothetical protein [Nanoarchaeota archaeon]HIH59539.1 hypothetical protein [Nanoarchaeota archaeon]HII13633.1 hypothetical protein [Nanoarchaeota archaeon]